MTTLRHLLATWVTRGLFEFQRLLLVVSYWLLKPFTRGDRKSDVWVVAGAEVASNVYNIGNVLEPSITVCFGLHPFYDYPYTYKLGSKSKMVDLFIRLIIRPVMLGLLLHRAGSFFYVGETGFLLQHVDGRSFEFAFVKKRGKRLVCSFLGTDIRSQKLLMKYGKEHDIDVMSTYDVVASPERFTDAWDLLRKRLAASADRYADDIFNAPVDQISYLTRPVHPPIYFYPTELFRRNDKKHSQLDQIKIVHAPSSPLLKGTPIVRAAIKKLKVEGYDFDYVELIGVPHSVVLQELAEAQIVLNEFYAFLPGQFGVEALAAHCALLTSADERIEPSLPPGSNNAWMVTPYWSIYENLKALLDNPNRIREYADSGFDWAQQYCDYRVAGERLQSLLQISPGDKR